MENNIITQMIEYDKENENTVKGIFDYIQDVNKIRFNALNNEIDKPYLNNEDPRTIKETKIIKANEIGLNLNKEPLLRFGSCLRELYFKITGAIAEYRQLSEIESIERNELVKQQWIDKILYTGIARKENHKILHYATVNFESTEDLIIYDPIEDREYGLLIKPVNDTASTVRNRIWSKWYSKPMDIHIPEICLNMFILKMPVKVLYVGKNNSEMIKEFNFGVNKNILTINKEEYEKKISIYDVVEDMKNIDHAIEKSIIPPRSFVKDELTREEVDLLLDNDLTNITESNRYYNGETYENFRCKSCRYNQLCNSLNKGWVNLNEPY